MLKEFRDFAMRGNVIDLAVAVIIGGAFGKIINSLVNDILMPLFGLALGGVNFSELSFKVGEAVVLWGAFVQAIVDFVIIAFVIFLIIRAVNKTKSRNRPRHPPSHKRNARSALQKFPSRPRAARIVHRNYDFDLTVGATRRVAPTFLPGRL
jgi:large conductance mechanosensitive channel